MYIKTVIIDGFKSYGQRTEINGFDPLFNAITGLNGSGKSNILDAICFLLGITNLSQVRASNLQELVYKNGQAGITKASVTITFDNSDKKQSPIGYEQYNEITITRQIVIGGRNKYLINGSTVQNTRVQDFFRSVQLNVNNPHFLIMQGRITKVLNMKPPEILGMIEEAAGTRMYESKKQQALKTIEKKDAKLAEIKALLEEEITPTLTKLRDERSKYLEFQKVQRQLEHLTKLYIAYQFVTTMEASEKASQEHNEIKDEIENSHTEIEEGENLAKDLEVQIHQLQEIRDNDTGGKLQELEKKLKEKEKAEVKISAAFKSLKETQKGEEKKLKQLHKSAADDNKALDTKEKECGGMQAKFDAMREEDAEHQNALSEAEKRLEAISSGMYESEGGQAATLQQQLIDAKSKIAEAKTETKQSEMRLTHSKSELKKKEPELKKNENQFNKDKSSVDKLEKEVQNIERKMASLGFDGDRINVLENERGELKESVLHLTERRERFKSRYPQLCFDVNDPRRRYDSRNVKGVVANLFKYKDAMHTTALEVVAGGKLYNIVVDNEKTGKTILESGNLRSRVTILPLSVIKGNYIEDYKIKKAQSLVGAENVQPAISLVRYEKEMQKAMEHVFGRTFICKDMDVAKKIAFHKDIMTKCVTIEGDVFDPSGTLSGGSRQQRESILTVASELSDIEEKLTKDSTNLRNIEMELAKLQKNSDQFNQMKQEFDIRSNEFQLCQQRLQFTSHYQLQQEINTLKETIAECEEAFKKCKEVEKHNEKRVKEIEYNIKNAKALKEQELKKANEALKSCQKKAEQSRAKWDKKKQEEEALKLEIEELKKSIEETQEQISSTNAALEQYVTQLQSFEEEVKTAKDEVKTAQGEVKDQKEMLSSQNKEINAKLAQKEKIIENNNEKRLHIKQSENKLSKIKNEVEESEKKVKYLINKHEWIAEDRKFFGQQNTRYDFSTNDPVEAGKSITQLEDTKNKLSKNVNMRAMNMLGKAEEQYEDLIKKKKIVETDKAKIENVIMELDEKKKEALKQAWEQVNKDFGSIFSTLLPGTQAKLSPPENQSVLDGLEVKVAFGDVWKESLAELSGGQRSLVALSLILALLLFKPAPIYILDEVDAALDLSHTQNIGNMLRTHFKHSQFIVVSLKDGMFNNANVLFKTRFVDGMSTVTRHTQRCG